MNKLVLAFRFSLITMLLLVVIAYASAALLVSKVETENPRSGQILQVDGQPIHAIVTEDKGPPIVLIHGAGGNAVEFRETLTPHLRDRHKVIMIDRPGHGYSERKNTAMSLEEQAQTIAGAIEQLFKDKRVVLVGHSYGAAVALRVGIDHPELLSGIGLIAPVSHGWDADQVPWYYSFASKPVVGHAFSQFMPLFGPAQARASLHKTFAPAPEPKGYYDTAGIDLMFRPASFRANAHDMLSLDRELAGQKPMYRNIRLPVLVFSGLADTSMDPQKHASLLAQDLINVQLLEYEDEGHVPHMRKAREISEAISELAFASAPKKKQE